MMKLKTLKASLFSIPSLLTGWQGIAIRIGLIAALAIGSFGYGWIKRGAHDAVNLAICHTNVLTLSDSIEQQNKSVEQYKLKSDAQLKSARIALAEADAKISAPSRQKEEAMLKSKTSQSKPSNQDCSKAILEIIQYKRSQQ